MTQPETIGQRLKRLRLKADLTIPELSEQSGVAVGTISEAERDLKDMRMSTLTNLLRSLGEKEPFRL